MKIYLVLLILFITIQPSFSQNDSTKTGDSVIYTCPMHPDIVSDKPGKCPKCGMELIQKKSNASEHKMNIMMCPMHGMVDMNHKHDEEKKGGMKMMKGVGIGMGVMMVVMMVLLMTD